MIRQRPLLERTSIELVVERPHEPEDPGKVEDGALVYFPRRPEMTVS